MNLYNLIFRMVILIPFLTQPPHERMYPNVGAAGCTLKVGAAGCGLVGAGGVLGLRPRGSLYEFVLYNLNEKCMNWYKNHTV